MRIIGADVKGEKVKFTYGKYEIEVRRDYSSVCYYYLIREYRGKHDLFVTPSIMVPVPEEYKFKFFKDEDYDFVILRLV